MDQSDAQGNLAQGRDAVTLNQSLTSLSIKTGKEKTDGRAC